MSYLVMQLTGHVGALYAMAFSPDGKLLATAGSTFCVLRFCQRRRYAERDSAVAKATTRRSACGTWRTRSSCALIVTLIAPPYVRRYFSRVLLSVRCLPICARADLVVVVLTRR